MQPPGSTVYKTRSDDTDSGNRYRRHRRLASRAGRGPGELDSVPRSSGNATTGPGGPMPYQPVPAQVDLPALEHEILDFWRDRKVFQRSLDQSQGRPEWVFY